MVVESPLPGSFMHWEPQYSLWLLIMQVKHVGQAVPDKENLTTGRAGQPVADIRIRAISERGDRTMQGEVTVDSVGNEK